MFLIIDNTEKDNVIFSFWVDNKLVQETHSQNEGLLVCVEKLLSSLDLKLKDIKKSL